MPNARAQRVLVVEDESLVAMLVEDILVDSGYDVIVAMRLEAGLSLAREADVHLAVLDVNLGEGNSYPIADILRERGIPFLFATGYGALGLSSAYQGIPTLQKPYHPDQLIKQVMQLNTSALFAH
ncbi:response regulator receiver domain-containing protein [Pseudomonas duriflava]|uniref:Response regulator receiver domain-containing protein n=1 Tax=Pseudomonas duriflava TaxID=459528 RepID=A0A562Q6V3_9PSED|nr:response regulator [Pseudomonas duriflava]TWI52482.1 response regulator receiver domain-containing protein [Pseudomonas duriflava]